MLQIRKVAKHVFEKISALENERIKEATEDELTKVGDDALEREQERKFRWQIRISKFCAMRRCLTLTLTCEP